MKGKTVATIYFGLTAVLTTLTALFTVHPSSQDLNSYYQSFFDRLYPLAHVYDVLFVFIFISFIFAGMGVIGGILEFVGEHKEETEVYQDYEKGGRIKMYSFLLLYGYVFLFSLMSFPEFLIYALGWSFPESLSFVSTFFSYMLFDNFVLITCGSILFGYKTFKLGVFSLEFFKTEYDPAVTDISKNIRALRQFLGCVIGTMGTFCAVLVFIFELYPNDEAGSFFIPKAFFFLTAVIQSIYFYLHREQYIDQLKPLEKQYGLKVGKGPMRRDKPKKSEVIHLGFGIDDVEIDESEIESDLRFNDS